jgi:RimJ/RimL family protein N-acetyltransferase
MRRHPVWRRVLNPPGAAPHSTCLMDNEPLVELHLDLARVDLASFRPALAAVAERGIRISTLAEECSQDPEALHKLYNLARVVHASPTWTLEEYLQRFDDRNAVFIARLGSIYVGYSYLSFHEQHRGLLQQSMTGVRPEFRRQGIATALKTRGILYARECGFQTIITRIRKGNEASLAMNRKMGFVEPPAGAAP